MSCLKPVSRNIKLLLLEAAYKADNARDTVDREFWLSRQSSWLHLATSYEYTDRVSDFLQEEDALPKTPFCSICDLPMRAIHVHGRSDASTDCHLQNIPFVRYSRRLWR